MPSTKQSCDPAHTSEFCRPSNDNSVAATQQAPSITLEQILEIMFASDWKKAWVCSFAPGPENWKGQRYSRSYFRPGNNNFVAIGLMSYPADPKDDRRASDSVEMHHVVFADDVGTKVKPVKWEEMHARGYPKPTFKIETSPGNQTWIWVLDEPIHKDDGDGVRALRVVREAYGRLGLSDPLTDDARYIRLPGVNSKQKYLDEYGLAPEAKLTEWNEGATLDIEQAASILVGTDWRDKDDADLGIKGGTSHAGALHRTADLNNPEPEIQLALELGMGPQQVRAGVVEANCPFIDEHTTRADTGFAFLGNGLMECSHASCQQRRTPDFLRRMREQYDERQAGRLALGLPLGGPTTAGEFLARASFAYHDNKAGQTVSDLLEQAEAMALAQHVLPAQFTLTPIALRASAAAIPPRQWLYGQLLIRGHVSLLVSPGGLGKSSLVFVEALAMATARPLLGDKPVRALKVWVHNGEDPFDELERRLAAAAQHHGVSPQEIDRQLYITSGRALPIKIVSAGPGGIVVAQPVIDRLVAMLLAAKVDVLIVDPFVTTHNAPENDNTAMNAAISAWREIADRAGCSVVLVHHVSKAAALDGDGQGIYGSRGGGAIIDGVRSARFLVRMTKDEAARLGIPESERWRYFRVHDGKSNLAPAAEAVWMRLASVPLHNGAGDWPDGDVVGVVEAWTPPKAIGILGPHDLRRILDAIETAPESPGANDRAHNWVGYLVADVMCLDIGEPGETKQDRDDQQNASRAQVRRIVSELKAEGYLDQQEVPRKKDGRSVPVFVVGRRAPDDTASGAEDTEGNA